MTLNFLKEHIREKSEWLILFSKRYIKKIRKKLNYWKQN